MKMDFYTLYLYFYFTHSTLQEILFEIQKIENIGIKKKLLLTILFSNVIKMSPFLPCQNKILAFKKISVLNVANLRRNRLREMLRL